MAGVGLVPEEGGQLEKEPPHMSIVRAQRPEPEKGLLWRRRFADVIKA